MRTRARREATGREVRRGRPVRVLALVARFKWLHVDYLHALGQRFDLVIAHAGEGHPGAADAARREGLRVSALPEESGARRQALAEMISAVAPEVIHALYYNHEELTILARELAPGALVVYECRDPLSTLERAAGSSVERAARERAALEASDAQVFVTDALRRYLERRHEIPLGASSMLVPHGFRFATVAPPQPKLGDVDGETHLALVGTASSQPGHSRYVVEIIERLTDLGFVVHSHFFAPEPGADDAYRALAARNGCYHCHATVSPRGSTALSRLVSGYDLMGVFHNLNAPVHDETDTLAVCMPTKAVCGWFHGGIPVVCSRHYEGLVEQIDGHGIGFGYEDFDDLAELVGDRRAIAAATKRTLAMRSRFSNEWSARRLERFVATFFAPQDESFPARSSTVIESRRVQSVA